MYEEEILKILNERDNLKFFDIIGKNGHFRKGKFTVLSSTPITMEGVDFLKFSKNRKYDLILVLFPNENISQKEIIDLHKNLTIKGKLVVVDIMKRSFSSEFTEEVLLFKHKYKIDNPLIIESLRNDFLKVNYSIKKKIILPYLWMLKISKESLLNKKERDVFNFSKYPFSKVNRGFIEFLVLQIIDYLKIKDIVVLFDGKKIGKRKTIDFWGGNRLNGKKLLVAPFLINGINSKGYIKKRLKYWSEDNELFIPIIKRGLLNNYFNFKTMTYINGTLQIASAIQKIDCSFLFIQNVKKNEKIFEYIMIKYYNLEKVVANVECLTKDLPYINLWRM
jgi:hypothetical protein